MLKRPISPDAALSRLEELCSRSEQCSFEVLTKLSGWGIGASDAKKILRELHDNKYVDDARFARAYVRDKFLFGRWGRRKIITGLMAKRVPRQLIDNALGSELSDNELYFKHLVALVGAKARNMVHPISYEDCQRLIRFGISRGYETSLVIKAVNRLKNVVADDAYEDSLVD